jgi:cytochrome P450
MRYDAQFHERRMRELCRHPSEYQKLRDNAALVTSMVPEIIRWVSPSIHMRRTAVAAVEVGGKQIKAGDKAVMWYVSGNRDEESIGDPNAFIITEPARGIICPSASVCIAVSEIVWPRCN